ncbi:hypothetical protein E2C01_088762 [Portunus trituberculatus]|uniref:Uncharacterized protein n=1 Tax=Portunus trituberculatus TaxID=210409 RepID=A0A5B7JKR6_PORTR|nr:hypothetical protein [Portunus trituberculatus]
MLSQFPAPFPSIHRYMTRIYHAPPVSMAPVCGMVSCVRSPPCSRPPPPPPPRPLTIARGFTVTVF